MAELTGICGPYDLERAGAALELIKGSNRGYLAVCDGRRDVCFQFAQGGLRVTWRGLDLPSLGDWMLFQGELRPQEAERLAQARGKTQDEREALTAIRVPEGRIDKGARSLMGRLALDALCWDQPHCDASLGEAPFRDDLTGDDVVSLRAGSGMQPLVEGLLSRLRGAGETLAAVPSALVSVVTTSEVKARERLEGSKDSLEGRLLERVLAKPGVHGAELLEDLGCGDMALVSLLAALTHLELLKVTPLPRDEADRREQGELLLNRSLAELPRRLWLGAIALEQGDRALAARHEARAGWLLVDSGRYREALERYGKALSQSPGDLEAQRGRVHVLWSLERVEEAAEDSVLLGRGLLEAGLPTHARKILEEATRARERIPLERLLLQALLQTGERRAAQELGASLLERLTKKGHSEDAQRVQALLDKELGARPGAVLISRGPRRASGLLKAGSGLSSLLCLGLVAGAWLGWSDLTERRAYALSATQAQSWLEGDVDLDQLDQLFPEENVSGTPAGVATGNLRSELELLRKDEEAGARLRELLRLAWDQDIEKAIRILDGAEAQTSALRQPLRLLREEAGAHLDDARNTQRRLQGLTKGRSLDRAFRVARRLLKDFSNVPSVINDRKRSRVAVRIDSKPSGALVHWQGLQVGATPMIVEINLVDVSQLVLERQGYKSVEREIIFAELEQPQLLITLTREGR